MAGSTYGKLFKISTWGESHGKAIGVVIDGVPAGINLSEDIVQQFLNRRRPGQSEFTTERNESDSVEILSEFLKVKLQEHLFQCLGIKISIHRITMILQLIIVLTCRLYF